MKTLNKNDLDIVPTLYATKANYQIKTYARLLILLDYNFALTGTVCDNIYTKISPRIFLDFINGYEHFKRK